MRIDLSDTDICHLTDERLVTLEVHHTIVVSTSRQESFTFLGLAEHQATFNSAEHGLRDFRSFSINHSLEMLQALELNVLRRVVFVGCGRRTGTWGLSMA